MKCPVYLKQSGQVWRVRVAEPADTVEEGIDPLAVSTESCDGAFPEFLSVGYVGIEFADLAAFVDAVRAKMPKQPVDFSPGI